MDNKTLSIVSYLSLIGWLVAYFVGKDNADSLLKYHLKQALNLIIVGIIGVVVLSIVIIILGIISETLGAIGGIIYLVFCLLMFILAILGIINAAKGEEKPLPFIGTLFTDKLTFLN